ncbi:hypothetical protein GGX14DRAFT_200500 [Mycena pura]|uniref:Protein kinase domain-containing protein n=1 Tax=Mycena pura TaxID=153505 RepID=A0AAD6Y456_9AGAR|nr:hypothetical protein GGX14DRAFT_200500 [Mycena pura]
MSSSSLGGSRYDEDKARATHATTRHSSSQVSGQVSWSMAIRVDESGDAELDESIPSSPLKELKIPSYWATRHLISLELVGVLLSLLFPIQTYVCQDLTGSVTKLDAYPYDSGGAADIYRGVLDASEFPEILTGTTFPELLTGTRFPELLTRNSFDSAGFSDVYRVMLNECDIPVAIKVFRRLHTEPQQLESKCKSLYEVARNFKRLNHPNILPFLGISLDLGLSPALITPLCSSGPVMKYFKSNPKNSREKLQIVWWFDL